MAFEPLEIKAFPEEIATERLVLKRQRAGAVPVIFREVDWNRAHLGFMPWERNTRSQDDIQAWFEACDRQWDAKQAFEYGLYLTGPRGPFIGNMGFHSISWESHRAEFGYWLAENFQGHGYVREAIAALERIAFSRGFHRLEIRCSALNERSAKVAQGLGYTLEGRLRQNSVLNGVFDDTLVYGKLRDEWRVLAKTQS